MDTNTNTNTNEYFEKIQKELVKEYEESEIKNLCIECGVDMGYCNPRQYCGKTYCMNKLE